MEILGGAQEEASSLEEQTSAWVPYPSCAVSLFLALPQQLPIECSEAPSESETKGEIQGGPHSVQDRPPHSGSGQVHLGV